MKRIIWLILLVFCVAKGYAQYSGGSGTASDPYLISSVADLEAVQLAANAERITPATHFRLTTNLDLKDYGIGTGGWNPIGISVATSTFNGKFHGGGHIIYNLTIDRLSTESQGLFGVIGSGAFIDSLGLVNVSITTYNTAITGGLVGVSDGATIFRCFVQGVVNGNNVSGGGIIGDSYLDTIKECFFLGSVYGFYAAGIVVESESSYLSQCYAMGSVHGDIAAGGISSIESFSSSIVQSYSTNAISAETAGGIAAFGANIRESAAFNKKITFSNSAYRITTPHPQYLNYLSFNFARDNMQLNSSTASTFIDKQQLNGANATEAQFHTKRFFVDSLRWTSFDNIWEIWEDTSSPYFTWQAAPPYVTNTVGSGVKGIYYHQSVPDSIMIFVNNTYIGSTKNIADGKWHYEFPASVKLNDTIWAIACKTGKAISYPFEIYVSYSYNEYDKQALREFLVQTAPNETVPNYERLSLTPEDTLTWRIDEDWVPKIPGLTWNNDNPKRLTDVLWSNIMVGGILDLNVCDSLKTIDCSQNKLTNLELDSCKILTTALFDSNYLAFSTMPTLKKQYENYDYKNQAHLFYILLGNDIDLSSEYQFTDTNNTVQTTSFGEWFIVNGTTLTPAGPLVTSLGNGKFAFDPSLLNNTLTCKMQNNAFGKDSLIADVYIGEIQIIDQSSTENICEDKLIYVSATPSWLEYQWQKLSGSIWQNISGATQPSYLATATGDYRVVLHYGNARDTSNVIHVTKYSSPKIVLRNPISLSAHYGYNAYLQITASTPPKYYEWYFNDTLTSFLSDSCYAYSIGTYKAVVYNQCDIATDSAFFFITKAPITITARSGQWKTYGVYDPILRFDVTSGRVYFNDRYSGSLSRDPGSDVGHYGIHLGTLSLGKNYDITFVGDTFEIRKAQLTITALSDTLPEGYNFAGYSGNYKLSGLVNNDLEEDIFITIPSVTIDPSVTSSANAGIYSKKIIVQGAAAANYDISYVNGDLFIAELNALLGISVNSEDIPLLPNVFSYLVKLPCNEHLANILVIVNPLSFCNVTINNNRTLSLNYDAQQYGNNPVTITVENVVGTKETYTLLINRKVEADKVFAERWGNVLLVPRIGLFVWKTVEWFKETPSGDLGLNREETKGYLKILETGDYSALIDKEIYTCPYHFVLNSTVNPAYPNPVNKNNTISIKTDLPADEMENAKLILMNMSGFVLGIYNITGAITEIEAPGIGGNYIVKIVTKTETN